MGILSYNLEHDKNHMFTAIWEGFLEYSQNEGANKAFVIKGNPNESVPRLQLKLDEIAFRASKKSDGFSSETIPFVKEARVLIEGQAQGYLLAINTFLQHIAPEVNASLIKYEADTRFNGEGPLGYPLLYKLELSPPHPRFRDQRTHDADTLANMLKHALLNYAIDNGHVRSFIDNQFRAVTDRSSKLHLPGTVSITQTANRLRQAIFKGLADPCNEDFSDRIFNTCIGSGDNAPACFEDAINNNIAYLQSFYFDSSITPPIDGFQGKELFFATMDKMWNDWRASLETQAQPAQAAGR